MQAAETAPWFEQSNTYEHMRRRTHRPYQNTADSVNARALVPSQLCLFTGLSHK